MFIVQKLPNIYQIIVFYTHLSYIHLTTSITNIVYTKQVTSSSTTALEEMRRENNVLKTDNTQLRTEIDVMKDEITQLRAKQKDDIGQLTTILDKMAVNNENQIQQINSQSSEIAQLKTENQQLKVSQ